MTRFVVRSGPCLCGQTDCWECAPALLAEHDRAYIPEALRTELDTLRQWAWLTLASVPCLCRGEGCCLRCRVGRLV